MSRAVMVYGAGGHGKVVAEILIACGKEVLGFLDSDTARAGSTVLGLPIFSACDWLRMHADAQIALGVGDNRSRERIARSVRKTGHKLLTVVHPSATIARSARIGEGVAVMPAAVLNADCEVAEGVIVNTGAIVEHDVRVDCYAHLSPGSIIGGGAHIGAFAHVGMGATVLPFKRVESNCVIGAGAVVVEDIPEGQTAYGAPARVRLKL